MPESLTVIYGGPLGHITWLLEGLETEVRHVRNEPMGSDKKSGY